MTVLPHQSHQSLTFGAPDTQHVIQGEFHVSEAKDAVLLTVLGSCVSACLFDPARRIGGMNHFLLPASDGNADNIRYAAAAMEQLLNALLKRGALKSQIQAKLFGGARMMQGLPDIGKRNGESALLFLKNEGITCVSQSLGGHQARRIRFWPHDGRAQQLFLEKIVVDPVRPIAVPPLSSGDVELF